MTDLALLALAMVVILASPHPVVGLVGGVLVYGAVGFRMWAAVRQAEYRWHKGR
jgi:hypothetical protein